MSEFTNEDAIKHIDEHIKRRIIGMRIREMNKGSEK